MGGSTEFTETIEFYGGTHLEQHGTRGAGGQGTARGSLYGPTGQRLGGTDWRHFNDADGTHESEKYSYTDGSRENHRVDLFPNGATAKQDSAQDSSGRFTQNDTDLTWQDHEIQSRYGNSTITTHASERLPDGRIHVVDGSIVRDGSGQQVGDVSVTEEIRAFNRQTTATTTLPHPDQSRDVITTRAVGDRVETFNIVLSQLDGEARPVRARLLDARTGQEQAVSAWVLLLDPRTAVQPRNT